MSEVKSGSRAETTNFRISYSIEKCIYSTGFVQDCTVRAKSIDFLGNTYMNGRNEEFDCDEGTHLIAGIQSVKQRCQWACARFAGMSSDCGGFRTTDLDLNAHKYRMPVHRKTYGQK